MEQEYDGTRALLITEESDRLSDLKVAFERLGCTSQTVATNADLKLTLRSQPFDIICVDYELALSQKFSIHQASNLQSKVWYVVVVPYEQFYQEQFPRAEYLDWGFQDLIVSPVLTESAHDILRRWERKLEVSKFDSKAFMHASANRDGFSYYKNFAKDLSSFRQESLQLLADYKTLSLDQLARKFKDRVSEAGFSGMAEKIQKLQKAESTRVPLILWKHVLDDCEQLERQIAHFLQQTGA